MAEKTPQAFAFDQQEDEEPIDLRKYWLIFWRHKWSIFGLGFLAALWGGFVVSSMQPLYRSTSTIMVNPDMGKVSPVEDVLMQYDRMRFYNTQQEVLRSRSLAIRVIERLDLANSPEFNPALRPKKEGMLSLDWKDWVRTLLPEDLALEDRADKAEEPAAEPAPPLVSGEKITAGMIARVQGSLSIDSVKDSRLLKISFVSSDRHLASQLANGLSDAYIEHEMQARLDLTSKATSFLTERLESLREKVRNSEQRLQQFRDEEKILRAAEGGMVSQEQLSALNSDLMDARRERIDLEAQARQLRGIEELPIDQQLSLPAVLDNAQIIALRGELDEARRQLRDHSQRYGPKHPKMQAAIAEVEQIEQSIGTRVQAIAVGVRKQYQSAVGRENSISATMKTSVSERQEIERKSYEERMLQREVDTDRQLYDMFLNRLKTTRESQVYDSVPARVLDPAVPALGPFAPNKQKIVLTWILGGLALGVGLAFLLEYLDNTFKEARDLEERLKLPVLGSLPFLKLNKRKEQSPLQYLKDYRNSFFSESIRSIRTAVLLSGLDDPYKVIVVTSSVPGEGKSTVAMTMAYSLGEMHKVLLIDADMRRPTVGKAWGMEKDAHGLSEFVSGAASLEECVHRVEEGQVYLMPSGAVPPNPLELLSSQRFAKALGQLGGTFEHIILDSAPTLAVSDAMVLASKASGVIYVARADSTPHPAATEGIKRLKQAKAHMIGTVINQVTAKNSSYYGGKRYGKYRGGYYGSYYGGYYGGYYSS